MDEANTPSEEKVEETNEKSGEQCKACGGTGLESNSKLCDECEGSGTV